EARAQRFSGRLASIYFGGGTPSLWRADQLGRVRAAVARAFGEPEEVTVEANPNDCRPATLAALVAAGVNRLSIRAQACRDDDLAFLGRDHDSGAAERAVAAARKAGFAEISLDLICALPGRNAGASLDKAVALAPEHLSVYQLTIEPRTPFGARQVAPASDDEAAAELERVHARLVGAGYEHYEVSSYAKPGHRARHNSLYWRGAPYLGLGNGAHSFWTDGSRGLRWAAHRSVARYLAGKPDPELDQDSCLAEVTEQDAKTLAEDRLWL